MNNKKIERWILLEQSGELSDRRKRILDTIPEAEEKRKELALLTDACRAPGVEPSPWVKQKILGQLRDEKRKDLSPAWVWGPVGVVAAYSIMVFAMLDFNPEIFVASTDVEVAEIEMWTIEFESDLVELESQILAMSGDPLDIMEM